MKTGRKPFYNTSNELEAACDRYFDECDQGTIVQVVRRGEAIDVKRAIPYTIEGLALSLGYADRHSIQDLAANPVFSSTIKRARSRVSRQRMEKALLGEQENRFAQFDLINNFGYTSSKQEVKTTHEITFSSEELDARLEALEGKMDQIEAPENAKVIDGEFAVKLIG